MRETTTTKDTVSYTECVEYMYIHTVHVEMDTSKPKNK